MLLSPSLLTSRDLFFSVSTDSSRLLGPASSGKEVLLLSSIDLAAFFSLLIPRSLSSEQLFTFLALEPSAPIKQISQYGKAECYFIPVCILHVVIIFSDKNVNKV